MWRRDPSSITSSSGQPACAAVDLRSSRSRSDDTPAPTKLCNVMLIVNGDGTRTSSEQRPPVTDRRSKYPDISATPSIPQGHLSDKYISCCVKMSLRHPIPAKLNSISMTRQGHFSDCRYTNVSASSCILVIV